MTESDRIKALEDRMAALERKLDALADALRPRGRDPHQTTLNDRRLRTNGDNPNLDHLGI